MIAIAEILCDPLLGHSLGVDQVGVLPARRGAEIDPLFLLPRRPDIHAPHNQPKQDQPNDGFTGTTHIDLSNPCRLARDVRSTDVTHQESMG